MPRIGEFKEMGNGFQGHIHMRGGKYRIDLIRNDDASDDAPDYIAQAPNGAQIGGAWEKQSRDNDNTYNRLSIDDPAMPSRVQANLVNEGNGLWGVMYSRDNYQGQSQSRTPEGQSNGMDGPPHDNLPDFPTPQNGRDQGQSL